MGLRVDAEKGLNFEGYWDWVNIFYISGGYEFERPQCGLLCVEQCPRKEFLESLHQDLKVLPYLELGCLKDVIKLG